MRVFTLEGTSGHVVEGATVTYQDLANETFAYIKIGEEGRGRKIGRLGVVLADPENEINRIVHGQLIMSPASYNPSIKVRALKEIEITPSWDNQKIVLVAKVGIGFRGGNSFTTVDGETHPRFDFYNAPNDEEKYIPLAYGFIAQGDAGNMGGGTQFISELAVGDPVLKVSYQGRMYGKPTAHFIWWDGSKVHSLTEDEYTHYMEHSVFRN